MKKFVHLGIRLVFLATLGWATPAHSFSTPCDHQDPLIIQCHSIVMENGEYAVYRETDAPALVEMIQRLREQDEYILVVTGGYSDAVWKFSQSKEVKNALDGGLTIRRGADGVDFLLTQWVGMTRGERNTRVKLLLGKNQTNETPPRPVTTFELTTMFHLRNLIDERADLRIQAWAQGQDFHPHDSFALLAKGNQLGELSAADRKRMEDILEKAEDPRQVLWVSVPKTHPELKQATLDLITDLGFHDVQPVVTYIETDQPAIEESQIVFLLQETGGDTQGIFLPPPSPPQEEEKPQTPNTVSSLEIVVGGSLRAMSKMDKHLNENIDPTQLLPTVDVGAWWNQRVGVTCRFQLPGSLFENEEGKLNLSEIQGSARVWGPLCATAAWGNFVSRNVEKLSSLPDEDLVYREESKYWALGLEVDVLNFKSSHRLCAGVKCAWTDQEFQLPRRSGHWTIPEETTQIQVHAGYMHAF